MLDNSQFLSDMIIKLSLSPSVIDTVTTVPKLRYVYTIIVFEHSYY